MKNLRETLNNVLMIGGLVTAAGGAIDAVRTVSRPEVRQISAMTQELRCVGAGPEIPICDDVTGGTQKTGDANRTDIHRLPIDTALVMGGGIVADKTMRKKKK